MLERIKRLYEKYVGLPSQVSPSLAQLNRALDEIKAMTISKEFKSGLADGTIDIESVGKLKKLQDAIKEKIDEISFHENDSKAESNHQSNPKSDADKQNASADTSHQHEPTAKRLMDDGDDLYWKGKWKEAYDLYEQVLAIEPNWLRAQEYSQKAKHNYDNKVGIPKTAIPDSVKFPFARAESALSRWELENAKTFIDIAKSEATKLGLGQWDELNDLSYHVENNLDIHKSFQSAISMPESQIDEAIEKIAAAFEQSRRPLYAQKLDELKQKKARIVFDDGVRLFKSGKLEEAILKIDEAIKQQQENSSYAETLTEFNRFKETQQEIRQYLETPKVVAGQFIEIENRFKFIQSVLTKYPEAIKNQPVLRDLQIRFDAQRPLVLSDIKTNILASQKRFDVASRIEDAEMSHTDGTELLNLYARLGADQNEVKRFTERKDSRQLELEKITSDVSTLTQKAIQKKRFSSKDEADRAAELLERFSNDPEVKKLQRALDVHENQRRLIIGSIVVGSIIVLSIFSYFALGSWNNYLISLTPTATMTFTPTPTLPPTITPQPTMTLVPSSTPLPTKMQVSRGLYARSGCYEKFRFTGRIPEGSVVTLLPSERKIDDLKRECVLAEYSNSGESVVGWVLLVDLEPINK